MSSAGVMIDLKDAVGTELGDCLIFQEKGKEVRKLDDFSTSHANPAQLALGFSYQVPPYPTLPRPRHPSATPFHIYARVRPGCA